MKININNPIAFGYDTTDKAGKRTFEALRITRSKEEFFSFSQYLLDSVQNPGNIVFLANNGEYVINFLPFARGIGLKSVRYNNGK